MIDFVVEAAGSSCPGGIRQKNTVLTAPLQKAPISQTVSCCTFTFQRKFLAGRPKIKAG